MGKGDKANLPPNAPPVFTKAMEGSDEVVNIDLSTSPPLVIFRGDIDPQEAMNERVNEWLLNIVLVDSSSQCYRISDFTSIISSSAEESFT